MTTSPRPPARKAARTIEAAPGEDTSLLEAGSIREVVRDARPLKTGEYLGRNGEILSLKRNPDQDLFYIPPHLMDKNYTYEWKRRDVLGKPDDTHWVHLHENGWRAVTTEPGSQWEGHFMPAGHRGPIMREGNILMERPRGMTEEVRAMEAKKANGQLRDNIDKYTRQRRGVDAPKGFTTANHNVPASISTGYDIGPAPDRQIE